MDVADYEKMGAFYLGKVHDLQAGQTTEDLLLYDSRDLTTHAVCLGMTGSGKTGLCLSLLEEAAIDGVPAIAIDPKGDLGNLMLSFPDLAASDFEPWIDPADAARHGRSVPQQAQATAKLWRKGLSEWGQTPDRIGRFRDAVEMKIYTPGSRAGTPIAVLRSLSAPPQSAADDPDALRDRVAATASGLCTLLGLNADPVRSREHILLATILSHAWAAGRNLDLPALIGQIQNPPVDRIGVIDIDAFFPASDRMSLAMTVNNLLASPTFAAWMEGEPLDIGSLLYTPEGRPRLSILSIAHLSESERMFFVTLLLEEVIAWMRTLGGTASLRALLYMDELAGYLPPTANPPSKRPLLTLLKQARAYGLGVVLASQNPVDLDYKALSNAGTWFLGRLQTERDKARVLDGLEGVSTAAGGFDRSQMEATLAGLGSRVFLMHNVHDQGPTLFHTRWALSWLRGPLTRTQIRQLCAATTAAPAGQAAPQSVAHAVAPAAAAAPRPAVSAVPAEPVAAPSPAGPPAAPAGMKQGFVPRSGGLSAGEQLLYRPALLGEAQLHFVRAAFSLDSWEELMLLGELSDSADPFEDAPALPPGSLCVDAAADPAGTFAELPRWITRPKAVATAERKLKSGLYRTQAITLYKCTDPKGRSEPGETQAAFRARLAFAAREDRDKQLAKLEAKYRPKLARLQERIRKAEARVEVQKEQYGQQKMQTAISLGSTILGALFGRKKLSMGNVGRAATTARGAGRAAREKQDIGRANEDLAAAEQKLADMQQQFEAEIDVADDPVDPASFVLTEVTVRPRKSDTQIDGLSLVWLPYRIDRNAVATPLWKTA